MSNLPKIAVITGSTKGLGRATAEKFAREGFDLIVCARNLADLEAMKSAIETETGNQTHIFQADFGKKEDVASFADFIEKTTDSVAVLINNAGIYLGGQIISESEDALERMLEVNLMSAYRLTRRILAARPPAHIFNMCSIASHHAYPNGGAYSISKFALLGFSKNLREELKPLGIKVTAISPGATWSDSWKGVDLPENRLMQARDIADITWAMFRLSPSAVAEDIILRPILGDL
jgi:short-subunit dehydrogenase